MRMNNYLKLLRRIEEVESFIPEAKALEDASMLEQLNTTLVDLKKKRDMHEKAMEGTQS